MSGPNDNGSGQTATEDFKLTLPEIGASASPSHRFKLKVAWQTPHLVWRPLDGPSSGVAPPPANPEAAFDETSRYFRSGLLFDLRRPDWWRVDKAFLSMPTDPPQLFPSRDQISAWKEEQFFRVIGRSSYLAAGLAPSAPSQFYKLPDPAAMSRDPGPPRAGEFGDVLKAVWRLPAIVRMVDQANDEAQRQLHLAGREWSNLSFWNRAEAVTLAATVAGGVVGTAIGVGEARRFAFKSLLGVDLPVPFVPGVSIKLKGYGAADDFLLGPPAAGSTSSRDLNVSITVDLRKAIKIVGKYF